MLAAVVATGTPEQVAEVMESHTGRFLRQGPIQIEPRPCGQSGRPQRAEEGSLYGCEDITSF